MCLWFEVCYFAVWMFAGLLALRVHLCVVVQVAFTCLSL